MSGWLEAAKEVLQKIVERLTNGEGLVALVAITEDLPLTGDPETDARIIELYYRHMHDYE